MRDYDCRNSVLVSLHGEFHISLAQYRFMWQIGVGRLDVVTYVLSDMAKQSFMNSAIAMDAYFGVAT